MGNKTFYVKTTFLNSTLNEYLYINLHEGWKEEGGNTEGNIGKFNKEIYGLNQESKYFHNHLTNIITSKYQVYP